MVVQVSAVPSNVVLVSWAFVGFTDEIAVQDMDDDTTYLARTPDGSDDTSSGIYALCEKAFTGLPANAQIVRVGFRDRQRHTGSGFQNALAHSIMDDGIFFPMAIGTSYSTIVVQWKNSPGVFADAGGNYTAKVKLACPSGNGLSGSQAVRVTYVELYIEYNSPPTAPTLTAPIGTIGTISPTMTGNHNDPDGDTAANVQIEVRRVSDNSLFWDSGTLSASGSSFSQAYAGSALVNGVAYKWRARTRDNVTGSEFGAWSDFTTFTPQTNVAPVATAVSPSGQIGTLVPTIDWTYFDSNGDAQSQYQIQVRRVSDAVSFWDTGWVISAATDRAYAGTALANGTAYEWRVRVQDVPGGVSNYTNWMSFTPSTSPNAPNLTTPLGLTNTLTPTIQGTYSQGGGGVESDFQYEIRQSGVTIYSSGDITTDIATGQAYGTNNPSDTPSTPPALAWGTSYEIRARSKDVAAAYSAWSNWQAFNTNSAPTTPTNLSPQGSIVSDTTPTLSWTHNDPDADAQTEVEIEVRKVSDDSGVSGYTPKALSQSTLTHDMTTALTSGGTAYKWRIRTKGTAGPGFGPWSAFVTFTVASAPTVVVAEPDPSEVITQPAFQVEWAISGGSGTQQDYRVYVYASDQTTVLYDSTQLAGTNTTLILPIGVLINGNTYYIQIVLRDTLSQTAQSDKILVITDWTPPATITGLQVTAVGSQPG